MKMEQLKREYIDREATKEELELILVEKKKLLEKK